MATTLSAWGGSRLRWRCDFDELFCPQLEGCGTWGGSLPLTKGRRVRRKNDLSVSVANLWQPRVACLQIGCQAYQRAPPTNRGGVHTRSERGWFGAATREGVVVTALIQRAAVLQFGSRAKRFRAIHTRRRARCLSFFREGGDKPKESQQDKE